MGKVLKIKRYRLTQLIFVLFLISFSPSLIASAEETAQPVESTPVETAPIIVPVVEESPVVEETPVLVEPVPVTEPIVEVTPVSEPAPIVDATVVTPPADTPPSEDITIEEDKDLLDKTFSDPVVETEVEQPESFGQQDPDKIFSEEKIDVGEVVDLSKKKDELNKFDDVFSTVNIEQEIKIEKKKVEALHSCAFDDFSIEIGSNEKKSTPILLKKSGPNKKFGLKVGSVPEGIEITFSTNNRDFTSGESGSPSLAQKFSVLETKAVNKELIFTESVLEEKDQQFKAKKEIKIDEREVVPEEIMITSSSNLQKGSFNIPIIYAESNYEIGEENFDSNSTIETNCQFNLIVK